MHALNLKLNLKLLLASVLMVAILASGAYSVLRSLEHPVAEGNYTAYTTGAASRIEPRIDWSDRNNAGFDQ